MPLTFEPALCFPPPQPLALCITLSLGLHGYCYPQVRRARARLAFLELGTSTTQVYDDCVLVPSFNSTAIRRHSESSTTRRTDRGVEPPFPSRLEPMRQRLAYGGAHSFSVPDMHSLDRTTHPRRCSCLDSTYHGILCAHGGCKHDPFVDFVLEARASPEAEEAVRARELAALKAFLHERERSKPEEARCKALYDATFLTATTTGSELVALLKRFPSIPPSGKGEEVFCVGNEASSEESERNDSEDEAAERVEVEEAIREGVANPANGPMLTCIFRAVQGGCLGLLFQPVGEEDSAMAVRVVACCPLPSGAFGPAPHDGEPIAPGDVVLSVNGESCPAKLLTEGSLDVGSATMVELTFQRRPRGQATELGGGSRALKAKHDWAARKASRTAAATSGMLGGSSARLGKKPQPTRASKQRASKQLPKTGPEVVVQAEALTRRLLATAQLTAEQRTERDAEMEGATYVA